MSKTKALTKEGMNVLLSEETTIYLVDGSGSMRDIMGHKDGQRLSKAEAVEMALVAMLEARLSYDTADKVGVVAFGLDGSGLVQTLMEPRVVTHKHIEAVKGIGAHNSTPMYQGFERAARELAEAEGLVRIVMLSDGEPNAGYGKDDILDLVEKLSAKYGFIVDCVGIGIPDATPEYDEKFLKVLASKGSGEFYPIDDIDELVKRLTTTARERKALLGGGVKLLGDASVSFR